MSPPPPAASANEPIAQNTAGSTQQAAAPPTKEGPGMFGDTGYKTEQIKQGGAKGFCGIDQMDWGEKGGKFYEFWKCEPQCGSPINGRSAALCCVTWWCCSLCAQSHLYASTLNQPCACVPHVLMAWCCSLCTGSFTRHNVRRRHNIQGNLAGDFICTLCCGCCSTLQMLRMVKVEEWAILDPTPEFIGKVPEIILIN